MLLDALKTRIEVMRARLHKEIRWQPFKGKYIDLFCDTLQAEVSYIKIVWDNNKNKALPDLIEWLVKFAGNKMPWWVSLLAPGLLDTVKDWLLKNLEILADKGIGDRPA